MKVFLLFSLLAVTLFGCTRTNNHFAGNWSILGNVRLKKGFRPWSAEISKESDKTYLLRFFEYQPFDTTRITYDPQRDILIGHFKGSKCKIEYLKDKDHLLVTDMEFTQSNLLPMEFERMNPDTVAAYKKKYNQ